ncbi:hypothetical protein CPC08DRAFT_711166 [Agrocybe pediades]|nr:hypothetical protein CPC08DRAFT_711166 [Agrocybe pediades]
MVELPPEIWLCIIDSLSRGSAGVQRDHRTIYPRLLSVNPVFLDVGLNWQWEEVWLSTGIGSRSNTQLTMHDLKRLPDPFISKRLKKLTIEFRDNEPQPDAISTPQETGKSQEIPQVCANFPAPYGHLSSRGILDCIIRALPQFQNIELIYLDWSMPSSYDDEQKGIFRSFWSQSPFVPNLKTLWLAGALKDHRTFIETMPQLPQLENVGFLFNDHYGQRDAPEVQDISIFTSHILPYIEGISSNLRLLCVRCATVTDCSPFFENLPRLPALRELYISMYWEYDWSLKDLAVLHSFLERCTETMQTLQFKVSGPYNVRQPADLAKRRRLDEFFFKLFTAKNPRLFRNLEDLMVMDHARMALTIDIVVAILQKTRTTIRKLAINNPSFNSEELAQVFDAAAKCQWLSDLRIYIDCFDWNFLDMLTRKLPSLQTVWITKANALPIINCERRPDGTIPPPADGPLKGWVYRDQWKLSYIHINETGGSLVLGNLRVTGRLANA